MSSSISSLFRTDAPHLSFFLFAWLSPIKTSTLRFHGNLTRGVNSRPIVDSFVLPMIRRNYFLLYDGDDAHRALAPLLCVCRWWAVCDAFLWRRRRHQIVPPNDPKLDRKLVTFACFDDVAVFREKLQDIRNSGFILFIIITVKYTKENQIGRVSLSNVSV